MLLIYLGGMVGSSTTIGLRLFGTLTVAAAIAVTLVSTYHGGAGFVREKEERTLGLLLLADVSSAQIVVAKLYSAYFASLSVTLSLLPLFLFCVSLGGISTSQVIVALWVLLATTFLGNCVGILLGLFAATEAWLQRCAIAASVVIFYCPWMFAGSLLRSWGMDTSLAELTNPFTCMQLAIRGQRLGAVSLAGGAYVLLGGVILTAAFVVLRRRGLQIGLPSRFRRWSERLASATGWSRRERPPILMNPIAWKDLYVTYGGYRAAWIRCAMVVVPVLGICGATLAYDALNDGYIDWEDVVAGACLLTTAICLLTYIVTALGRAARAFLVERQGGTLELLLLTRLRDDELVSGKVKAISLGLIPWLIATVASLVGGGFVEAGAVLAGGIYLVFFLCMLYPYAYFALYLSLKLNRNVTAAVVAGFVAWMFLGVMVIGFFSYLLACPTCGLALLVCPVLIPLWIAKRLRTWLMLRFRHLALPDAVRD